MEITRGLSSVLVSNPKKVLSEETDQGASVPSTLCILQWMGRGAVLSWDLVSADLEV